MIAVDLKYNVPMNNDNNKIEQPPVLEELKTVFCDFFEDLVDDCCYQLENEFGIQLGQKRIQIGKPVYTQLLQLLKQQKSLIKKHYLDEVETLFQPRDDSAKEKTKIDLLGAGLSKDTSVEQEYVIKMIVRNTNSLFLEDINTLNKKIAAWKGKRILNKLENPVSPENLVQALSLVINQLELQDSYKTVLFKVFDEKVFSQLGFVYKELNKIKKTIVVVKLKAGDEPANNKAGLPGERRSSEESGEFSYLQKKLAAWRVNCLDSAYHEMSASYGEQSETFEAYEVINALEIIRQFSDYDNIDFNQDDKPLKWLVKQKLDDINSANSTKILTKDQEDILDLISYLFKSIKQDELIVEPLRMRLLKLQYPFAELSLSAPGFLVAADGVGRQLIDCLYGAGRFICLDMLDNSVVKKEIDKLVEMVFTDMSCGIDEIHTLLNDFIGFIDKNHKRNQILQQRSVQLIHNKEKLQLAKQRVHSEIIQNIQDIELPEKIVNFLFEVWQDYLLLIYLHKDEEPDSWLDAVTTMQNLICSVIPPNDEIERKKTLKLLPALIKELRVGLKRISYDRHLQSIFFKELAVFHVLLMNKNAVQATNQVYEESSSEQLVDLDSERLVCRGANKIKIGQWLSFINKSIVNWGQLAWRSKETNSCLFTDKNGTKLLEISLYDLENQLQKDQIKTINYYKKPFTQEIFSQL